MARNELLPVLQRKVFVALLELGIDPDTEWYIPGSSLKIDELYRRIFTMQEFSNGAGKCVTTKKK